ncbi:MAG: FAD-dependent oxidoreductase [Actinobacteria bacterium]|nr:FAD-dependent oxidoreductase [Actinomycetota bacterium]
MSATDEARYRGLSLWHETVAGSLRPRASLPGSTSVDVAIVGAGLTGVWTAYYLLEAEPSLRIALLDAEIAGFGASGRNGGWLSALFPVSASRIAAEHGRVPAMAQYAAMRDTVAEVIRVAAAEGIAADIAHGGTVVLARSAAQVERARDELAESDRFDLGVALLDAAAARALVNATDIRAATYTPHCAAVHPAKLIRGLAAVVEARGARIYERTTATSLRPGVVETDHGPLHAETVIRATEGYTATLAGLGRRLVPVYSLMIATEPLPERCWEDIGLNARETFSDERHLIVYGQRTADDRLVFGGRGAPYHFGSGISDEFDRVPRVFTDLERTLVELFPMLAGTRITHRWGGPLGVARDWHASVGLRGGIGWAGGYVGDGLAGSNLAGRTLRDLILARSSPLTTLPWVGHRSPDWEPEPLRWLGANAGLRAMVWADAAERRGGRPSRLADAVNRVIG